MNARARHAFYRDVCRALSDAGFPYLIGGAYAMRRYAGVRRDTKDLDLFLSRPLAGRAIRVLTARGFEAKMVAPHWLGKVLAEDAVVDLIFASRNGLCAVDVHWFSHAPPGRMLGLPVRFVPPEEMIWSKAFVMARDRFDGADIAQLIRARGRELDWARLLERFESHWPVLLQHLVHFAYVFPSERDAVPRWLIEELEDRRRAERPSRARLCRGTLLSPEEYVDDIRRRGYRDARARAAANEGLRRSSRG